MPCAGSCWLGYEARLHPGPDEAFTLSFDPDEPWTHKSRYFLDAALQGEASVDLTGNDQDNRLRGNAGDNRLDGAAGMDTAIYCGEAASYAVSAKGADWVVEGPDGRDVLVDIEAVHFADGGLRLASE